MAIVMAMVILSSSRSAKGSDGGYSDEGGDDGNGDGDGDGDSQCKFNGEKFFFQIFFFNTAKLVRLGGILAYWPPFGILAHASKSAGIVALFSYFISISHPFLNF